MREMKPVVDDSAPRSAMKSNRREMARVSFFFLIDIYIYLHIYIYLYLFINLY